MRNIATVFKKEIKDTIKNKTILIQFILFPIMTLIMENTININGMTDHFFAKLFSVMYIGMAPLSAVSSIISEEKEANTLRVLRMSNVKSVEYLLGVCTYVWLICMIGSTAIAFIAGFSGKEFGMYLLYMAIGTLISGLFGGAIGIYARNQMVATSIAMPLMMIFSFVPMISMFNNKIEKYARFIFTGQLNKAINNLSCVKMNMSDCTTVLINIMIASMFFIICYRKNGLE